jgi:hypothetical protein
LNILILNIPKNKKALRKYVTDFICYTLLTVLPIIGIVVGIAYPYVSLKILYVNRMLLLTSYLLLRKILQYWFNQNNEVISQLNKEFQDSRLIVQECIKKRKKLMDENDAIENTKENYNKKINLLSQVYYLNRQIEKQNIKDQDIIKKIEQLEKNEII